MQIMYIEGLATKILSSYEDIIECLFSLIVFFGLYFFTLWPVLFHAPKIISTPLNTN